MKLATVLKMLSKAADTRLDDDISDVHKYSEDELREFTHTIAALQNHLAAVQDLFDENGRNVDIWRG